MKKWFVAAMCIACLGMVSMGVAADAGKVINSGSLTWVDPINADGTGDPGYGDRYNPPTYTPGDQSATVTLTAKAVLPCYLELTFQGNGANATLQSFGPGSAATWSGYMAPTGGTAGNVSIDFSPAISGFVNSDWSEKAPYGTNKQVAPGDGIYIPSCDIFRSEIKSNLDYNYSVASSGLTMSGFGGSYNLPIQMRTAIFAGTGAASKTLADAKASFPTTASDLPATNTADILGINGTSTHNVGTTTVVYQQFRVPYDTTRPAGEYSGSIVVKAWTL